MPTETDRGPLRRDERRGAGLGLGVLVANRVLGVVSTCNCLGQAGKRASAAAIACVDDPAASIIVAASCICQLGWEARVVVGGDQLILFDCILGCSPFTITITMTEGPGGLLSESQESRIHGDPASPPCCVDQGGTGSVA